MNDFYQASAPDETQTLSNLTSKNKNKVIK